jgi:hypothetical protein
MQCVGESDSDRRQAGLRQSERKLSGSKDPNVATLGFEVVVAEAQVEVFARGGWNRDRQTTSGPCDPSQLAGRSPVIVDVFHDLRADDLVECAIRKRQPKRVSLNQRTQTTALGSALPQVSRAGLERGEIEVEAYDVCTALQRAKAMPPLAATRVEDLLARANPKSIEIDGEQHESFPRIPR